MRFSLPDMISTMKISREAYCKWANQSPSEKNWRWSPQGELASMMSDLDDLYTQTEVRIGTPTQKF
jgi:hypothetical protein